MMTAGTVDLSTLAGRLGELADALGSNEVSHVLMAGAYVLEAEAKQNVQRMKAIDTGFLLNSIHSTSTVDSNYSDARTKARGRNGDGEMLAEYATPKEAAAVACGASYGMFVEYGTVRMPARPFMRQAVATASGDAIEAIGDAIGARMERIFHD